MSQVNLDELEFLMRDLKRERDSVSFVSEGREFQREMVEGKKEFLKADVLEAGLRKFMW